MTTIQKEDESVDPKVIGSDSKLETKASESDIAPPRASRSTLITFGIAIILHSFIDGLAIGIFDEADELAVLAAGVIIHKFPVSFTVGVTFN